MGVFRRRSFRVDILTAFGALLLITLLAVIFYNYRSTTRIVLLLCDALMKQTTQTVISQTVGFLNPPGDLTKLSAQLVSTGLIPANDLAKLERFSLSGLQSQPQLAMFFFGDRLGNFVFAKPEADGTFATKLIDRRVDPPITTWKYWDKALQLIRTATKTTDLFDPRTRPWYRGAQDSQGIYWTDLYIFFTANRLGITVSYPVVNAQGQVLGVIGCDIELAQLSHFLRSLKIGQRGLAFIFNEKQELVAYPDLDQIMVDPGETGLLRPFRVDSLDNRSVVAAYQEHVRTGQEDFALKVNGERYRASFSSFPPASGKPWKVGVVVPEDDFIGVVKDLTRRVLVICLIFLVLSVLMAILLARRISRPILKLAAETDHIRHFRLDEPLDLESRITEIQYLNEAINRMKVSLRSFLRFAPQQLVEEVVLGGKELMLGGDRREVTLLFSDLRGFTQFAERTRPEDVVQILNVHFDAMVRIISDHGGYVVDFLGDSLFAVFGAPKNDPGHALQAIKCALTMQLTRQRLNDGLAGPHLPRLEMGIGINSGSCVAGNMGSQMRIKYGVVGHAVNLAARIETFTVGGQILISEATRILAAGLITVKGPLQAYGKGVEGVIRLWEVRSLIAEPALVLPPTVPGLVQLSQPVPVAFRLITGKQIAPELYGATMTRLSATGMALTTAMSLDDFAAIQLQFPGPAGQNLPLDGKVIGTGEAGLEYIFRFSPLDKAGAAAVSGILAKISPAQGG